MQSGQKADMSPMDFYIYAYPEKKTRPQGALAYDPGMDNLTIGDLHANPIKLLHILIQNGIADIKAEPDTLENKKKIYLLIVQSYSANNAREFHELIFKYFSFNKDKPFVRLIGDTLADRGINDFFIFSVLLLMRENKVKYEISLSNHDGGFLNLLYKFMLKRMNSNDALFEFSREDVSLSPADSLVNMCKSISLLPTIAAKLEAQNFMLRAIAASYLPNLKLIGYEYDASTNTFNLSWHGVIGLAKIQLLAKTLGVELNLDKYLTPSALISAFDDINAKVKQLFESGTIYKATHLNPDKETNHPLFPLFMLMWQRAGNEYDETDFMQECNGIRFCYQHGHDYPKFTPPAHIKVLDNMRGKFSDIKMEPDFYCLSDTELQNKYGFKVTNITADYTLTRGINCVFYEKLKYNLDKLTKLVKLVANHPFSLFNQNTRDKEKIEKLNRKIQLKISYLPQEQQGEYSEKLQAIMCKTQQGIEEPEPENKRGRLDGSSF